MAKKELLRNIADSVQRQLWARAAGRCQFAGCNRILYRSPVTLEDVNISEQAHIYSFSKDGPRGHGPHKSNSKDLNNIENLMLVCHDCHKKIDADKKGEKYSAQMLQEWKSQHEQRIYIATGIDPEKKTNVVFYTANISEQASPILKKDALLALTPNRYPIDENSINLSMKWAGEDNDNNFWNTEQNNLKAEFNTQIKPRMGGENSHFSIFALAPIPLLIVLGTLFTDKPQVDVYQLIREPKTWKWQTPPNSFAFKVIPPTSFDHPPVLVMSLSAKINHERVKAVLSNECSVWEITVDDKFCNNDFMRSREQLIEFSEVMRKLISRIKEKHGDTELSIFPAIPVSCAVTMGLIRMPKADMPWVVYDQSNKVGKFIHALKIGETNGK